MFRVPKRRHAARAGVQGAAAPSGRTRARPAPLPRSALVSVPWLAGKDKASIGTLMRALQGRDLRPLLEGPRVSLGLGPRHAGSGARALEDALSEAMARDRRATREALGTLSGLRAGPDAAVVPADYHARIALLGVVAECLRGDGTFDRAQFERRYPGGLQVLLTRLDSLPKRSSLKQDEVWIPTRELRRGWSPALEAAVRREFAHAERAHHTPLISFVARRFGAGLSLKNTWFLGTQHLLERTERILAALEGMGLRPSRSWVTGKPVSTNVHIEEWLVSRGYAVLGGLATVIGRWSDPQANRQSWEPPRDLYTAALGSIDGHKFTEAGEAGHAALALRSAFRADPSGPILVLDDGAVSATSLLSQIEREERGQQAGAALPRPLAEYLRVVEQTTHGLAKLLEWEQRTGEPLPFPAIAVADCTVKTLMESVLIAASVREQIERSLEDLKTQGVKVGRTVVQVGYGNTGRALALAADDQGDQVLVVEKDPTRRARAERDGFKVLEKWEALAQADQLVLSTGRQSLEEIDFAALKDGCVIFSASSGTVEFPRFKSVGPLRLDPAHWPTPEMHFEFQGKRVRRGGEMDPHHWCRRVDWKGDEKQFLIANALYPVNFTGAAQTMNPEWIQLTRALLLLAVIQALKLPEGSRGIIPLSRAAQREVAVEWMRLMRRKKSSFSEAMWRQLEAAYEETLRVLDGKASGGADDATGPNRTRVKPRAPVDEERKKAGGKEPERFAARKPARGPGPTGPPVPFTKAVDFEGFSSASVRAPREGSILLQVGEGTPDETLARFDPWMATYDPAVRHVAVAREGYEVRAATESELQSLLRLAERLEAKPGSDPLYGQLAEHLRFELEPPYSEPLPGAVGGERFDPRRAIPLKRARRSFMSMLHARRLHLPVYAREGRLEVHCHSEITLYHLAEAYARRGEDAELTVNGHPLRYHLRGRHVEAVQVGGPFGTLHLFDVAAGKPLGPPIDLSRERG